MDLLYISTFYHMHQTLLARKFNIAAPCHMDFINTNRKTHFGFPDEDRSPPSQSPPHLSIKTRHDTSDQDLHFSPPKPSTPSSNLFTVLPPPSPESPWRLSPHQTPSPSLLYKCISSLHRQDGCIHAISISKGTVFTGSDSKRIHAWRQPDCFQRGCIKASCGQIRSVLAYGNTLFTAHKDRKIRMWNFTAADNYFRMRKVATIPKKPSLLKLTKQQLHKDRISCMSYYYADRILYTCSYDKTVKAWRISDKRCVDSFTAHEGNINSIVVNQDDGCVFTCSSDATVKIWRRVYNENSHTLTLTLKFQQSPVNALALTSSSSGNCFLYSGCSDGIINFWEKEKMSGRFNHGGLLQGHRLGVLCLVGMGKLVFSGSEDATIRVWRREEGSYLHECLAVLDGHRGPVKCLAACLEMEKVVVKGYLVYSGSLDRSFKVWRVKVMPEQEEENKGMMAEYDMSPPVLSPSWVEKKIKSSDVFFQ